MIYETKDLFARIKKRFPQAREISLDFKSVQIRFSDFVIVHQIIRYRELFTIIIKNESIQTEKQPRAVWEIVKEYERNKMFTKASKDYKKALFG